MMPITLPHGEKENIDNILESIDIYYDLMCYLGHTLFLSDMVIGTEGRVSLHLWLHHDIEGRDVRAG